VKPVEYQPTEQPSSPKALTPGPDTITANSLTNGSMSLSDHSTNGAINEEDVERTIEERLAASRRRLQVTDCLFCNSSALSLEENLTHMASIHSFFIPEAEYLIDIPGLLGYLGEKLAIGNACLYCNRHDGKGREFRSLDAVRKHMIDKSHCKIAYSSEEDQLEIGDFYDFRSSYPDAKKKVKVDESDEGWEDMDSEDGDLDEDAEVIDIEGSEPPDSDATEDDGEDEDDELFPNQITYGDSHKELVLPSGARIGHRSLKPYYAQRFRSSTANETEDPKSGTAFVRRLLREKSSALVPRKGGYGAYGLGNQLVKARNPGEAREAGRHVREFRDQRRREEFKTKVAFIHNSQKHFRDPLLQ
jgi:pre-60S factor REI1